MTGRWWITSQTLDALVADARVLEQDSHGVKVWLDRDGRIIKLFRIKRVLSLSTLYPHSFRFRNHARRLRRLGIASVEVQRVFFCPARLRHGVIYPLLEGETLERLLAEGPDDLALWSELAALVATLHARGVYFRSLHLGNVLRLVDGRLGLIDVSDMRIRRGALSPRKRARNFAHLLRREADARLFSQLRLKRFIDLYRDACGWRAEDRKRFDRLLERRLRQSSLSGFRAGPDDRREGA